MSIYTISIDIQDCSYGTIYSIIALEVSSHTIFIFQIAFHYHFVETCNLFIDRTHVK